MIGWDLITALVVITALSVLTYFCGRRLGRSLTGWHSLLFAESLAVSLTFAWFLAGGLFWARAVPGSGVLYWTNWMPLLLGFTAGLAQTTPGLQCWRRPLTVTAFGAMSVLHLAMPIMRPLVAPPEIPKADLIGRGGWSQRVCLQSHEATCAPAAAATLLNLNRIPVSEQQMIRLCLTSRQGTEPLGLYRGLKLASEPYSSVVRIASGDPGQWSSSGQLPNVALVRFSTSRSSSSIGRLLGPRGEGHAIVVFGYEDGQWILGDPAVGGVRWTDDDFRRRFTGDAIYLAAH